MGRLDDQLEAMSGGDILKQEVSDVMAQTSGTTGVRSNLVIRLSHPGCKTLLCNIRFFM